LKELNQDKDNNYFVKEKANQWTHGLGVLFAVLAMPVLLFKVFEFGSTQMRIGVIIFAFSFTLLFIASTLFHSIHHEKWKNRLRIFDHISIYYLIAGTYTPFILIFMWNKTGISVLILLWVLSLIGTVFKLWFTGRFDYASTAMYLLMGWVLIFIGPQFLSSIPGQIILWIIIGGIMYTLGVVFYIKELFTFHHAVWHVFVLLGAVAHYIAVYLAVLT
jgi:hemolysin III